MRPKDPADYKVTVTNRSHFVQRVMSRRHSQFAVLVAANTSRSSPLRLEHCLSARMIACQILASLERQRNDEDQS